MGGNMEIERLKELQIAKQVMILNQAVAEHDGYSQKGDQDFAKAVDVVIPLIDAEIARQSEQLKTMADDDLPCSECLLYRHYVLRKKEDTNGD
jgi:hypothetical protein